MTYHIRVFNMGMGFGNIPNGDYVSAVDNELSLDAHLQAEADAGYHMDSMNSCGANNQSVRVVTKSRATVSPV